MNCRRSAELLGESDEKPFRPADVAEPIRVLVLNHFAHELRAARAEPLERLIEIVYCEHGNQFDPANIIKDYEDPLDTPLGDHIVTDLIR